MAAYEDSGLTRKVELLKKLVQVKPVQFQSVQDYVNKLVMTSINAGLGDELVATLLLVGLPNEYQAFVMAVANSKARLTIDCVNSLLLQDVKFDCIKESNDNAKYSKNFQQKKNDKSPIRKSFVVSIVVSKVKCVKVCAIEEYK